MACEGTFESKEPHLSHDTENCTCVFRESDLIWMIGGAVLMIAACSYGIFYVRRRQSEDVYSFEGDRPLMYDADADHDTEPEAYT